MPLYDYKCIRDTCGKTFESISKPYEPVKCPHCGTYPAERLLSAHGGYHISGDNSASQRPSQAGSFKKKS